MGGDGGTQLLRACLNRLNAALLVNPANPTVAETESREAQLAAHSLGVDLQILNASTERDLDAVFVNLIRL